MTSLSVCASRCTGKERDSESNNDYFGARYYGSTMGRFMSPDWNSEPEAIPFADLRNPQSLNLYAYVNNNPLRMADPDGHDGEDDDDEGDPQATITAPAPTAPSPVGVEPEIPGGGVLVTSLRRLGVFRGVFYRAAHVCCLF